MPAPAPGNRPHPAADARAPPVGAVPYPAQLGNRPRPASEQPPPTLRASWERPPRAPAATNRSRAPLARPLLPPLQFLPRSWPQPPHGEAPPAADLTSARAAVPEPSPPPFFPAVRTPSSPLSPRATYFPFRRP
ncbi:uncharacterized protein [Miscanthus floridulus]|uniref:uncharacterized protein n=1 Tax=Miscanthus floridulus TaxID=154761 RepID=UPI003457FD59